MPPVFVTALFREEVACASGSRSLIVSAILVAGVAILGAGNTGRVRNLRRHRRHDRGLLLSPLLHLLLRRLGRRAHVRGQQRLQVPQGQPLRRRRPLRPDRVAEPRPRRRVAQEPRPGHADRVGGRDVRQEDDPGAARGDRQGPRTSSSRSSGRSSPRARTRSTWHDDAKGVARDDGERPGRDLARQERDQPARQGRARPSIKNLQYWFSTSNDGFDLAYSTHHFNGADGDPKYSYEKRNGFTIAWTAKGEIPPAQRSQSDTVARRRRAGARPPVAVG